jgi:hypothetical protein
VAAVSSGRLPPYAAWRHRDVRDGFEVVFLQGRRFQGTTAAVEGGDAWAIEYAIAVDADWATRSVHVVGRSAAGRREVTLEGDGTGSWEIDGTPAPQLDGCLDVDLESSSFTNALPVQRMRLEVGQAAGAPAAYVRAHDLSVARLEQRYARVDDERGREAYGYEAPRFDYAGRLVYDDHGLVLAYPGLAERAA